MVCFFFRKKTFTGCMMVHCFWSKLNLLTQWKLLELKLKKQWQVLEDMYPLRSAYQVTLLRATDASKFHLLGIWCKRLMVRFRITIFKTEKTWAPMAQMKYLPAKFCSWCLTAYFALKFICDMDAFVEHSPWVQMVLGSNSGHNVPKLLKLKMVAPLLDTEL